MGAFFLIPLSAFLADLLLFLSLRKRNDLFGRTFLILALFLGTANLLLAMLLISDGPGWASWTFHLMRHALFPVPVLLLAVSLLLSDRSLRSPMLILPSVILIVFLVLINFTFFSGSQLLVADMQKHSYGYFPVLKWPALLLLGLLFGSSFVLALYVFLSRKPENESILKGPLNRRLPFLLLLWWLGFGLNLIPLSGGDFPPMGMAVDALICILFASHMLQSSDRLFRISEMLGALSAGALGGTLLLLVLPDLPQNLRTLAFLVASVVSAIAWTRAIDRPAGIPGVQQTTLPLTKQEQRICELISEGYNRRQIGFFLGVTDGTLRNHLMNIYGKVLEDDDGRDRFQRLTVFLQKHDARHGTSAET